MFVLQCSKRRNGHGTGDSCLLADSTSHPTYGNNASHSWEEVCAEQHTAVFDRLLTMHSVLHLPQPAHTWYSMHPADRTLVYSSSIM